MPRISRVKERRLAEEALAGANAKIKELEDDRLLLQEDYDRLLGAAETACSMASRLQGDLDVARGDRTLLIEQLRQTREDLDRATRQRDVAERRYENERHRCDKAENALHWRTQELDNARVELGRLRAELAKASAPRGESGPGVLRFENKKQWMEVVRLVHPDVHNGNQGRKELAERVTKLLIGARPA